MTADDRVIKSKGVYEIDTIEDVDSEYIQNAEKTTTSELTDVIDNMLETLMQKEEDKVKEREELKKIEKEQRAVGLGDFMAAKKAQCVKSLGAELYENIYDYLKKAKTAKKDYAIVQKEVASMVANDKDKMNMVFFIDQIVDKDMNS